MACLEVWSCALEYAAYLTGKLLPAMQALLRCD